MKIPIARSITSVCELQTAGTTKISVQLSDIYPIYIEIIRNLCWKNNILYIILVCLKTRIPIKWIKMDQHGTFNSEIGNDGSVASSGLPPQIPATHMSSVSLDAFFLCLSCFPSGLQGWAMRVEKGWHSKLVRTAALQLRSVEWVGVSYFGVMNIQNCQLFWYEQKIRNGYHGFDPAKSVRLG